MAETQPVTVAVSSLDDNPSEEPCASDPEAGMTDEGEPVNDDCVRGSSVEVGHDITDDPGNVKDDTLQAAGCNSVIAGVYIMHCHLIR